MTNTPGSRPFAHRLAPLVALVLFGAALYTLHHALAEYRYHDIARSIEAIPTRRLAQAVALTALGYLMLSGYDVVAFRYIRHPLRTARIVFASFIAYAFSQNLGLPMLMGGSVRYRLYSTWGLSALEIANVVAFTTVTFWLGILMLGGLAFLLEPSAVPDLLRLPLASLRPLGLASLAAVASYVAWCALGRKPIRVGSWVFPPPPSRLALQQLVISCLDWGLAGAVLYVLLPPGAGGSFPAFLGVFLLAQVIGVASHVPGGLGVFETVLILMLAPRAAASSVLGSLLAYRAIYYLLPLGVALVMMATYEALRRRVDVARIGRLLDQSLTAIAPTVLALTTFVGGVVLLFSGATPAVPSRLAWLRQALPLGVLELSHFAGSLAGLGLLILARGLQRRVDAAYLLTLALLAVGIFASLLKGLDYEEAVILALMLAALAPARRHFYRKAALTGVPFTAGWTAAVGLALVASAWLGFFAYKHVSYSSQLWWRFEFSGDAPRFLRATLGSAVAAVIFALSRLMRPARPEPALPTPQELERAEAVVAESPETLANLALLGDKALLFSERGKAFVMYGVVGRSWIALGDPVGAAEERSELIWKFRELSDRHGGWTVFYEVHKETLHLYLDIGLALLKLGEEARVPLDRFSLEGGHRKGFRRVLHLLEREGCCFEVAPREVVPQLLPELEAVSDAWLEEKRTREKGFSLGFFDGGYLSRFPAGVVRRGTKIVAFANIWLGAGREELSVDLMRYVPEAPAGVMDYLFIQLLLWGRGEGYRWFNLGMAPLSGLETRALAPLWSRLGALVTRHAEHFYNFQGLRQYKDKFDPVWEPRYLASPGGLALPRVLANVTSLISGGLRGVVAK